VIALDINVIQNRLPAYASLELRRSLSRIEKNVWCLDRLIHDLRDLAAIDDNSLTIATEQTELSGLVVEAVHRTTPERDLYRVYIEAHGPLTVNADPMRIERVIANLVHNALQCSPSSSRIDVRLDRCSAGARIAVHDAGPGLAPDEAMMVFDQFRRAQTTHGHDSIGLGLFVGRRIVEAHRGSIGVASTFGKGSQFYFVLPV
jgi:K+-sensing histidine kinase KdpD